MRRLRRVATMLLAFMLVLGLTGCAAFGAPATTEQLLARYVANENVGNFGAKVDVGLNVNAMGVRAAVPVTIDLRAANSKAHGTVNVDLSSLDTRPYTMEFYAELLDDVLNCYIGTPTEKGTTWKYWKVSMAKKVDLTTLTRLLSSSEITLISKDSDPEVRYELTVPTAKVIELAYEIMDDFTGVVGMDEQTILDAVGDDRVRFGFNEECLLHSLESGVSLDLRGPETNGISVRLGIDVAARLSDYGSVDPNEVAIPLKVRQGAIPTAEPVDVIDVIGADSPLAGAVNK